MPKIDDVLSGVRSATICEIAVLVREVRVRIGVLSKAVTIRIFENDRSSDPFTFETSAMMKTSAEGEARPDHSGAPTEGEALRRAIRTLTQDYEDAVRRGEMPDDRWLVESVEHR